MIPLLLYSDMPVVAEGLSSVLASGSRYALTVVAGTMKDLRAAVDEHAPEIVLVDLTAACPPGFFSELDRSLLTNRVVLWVYEIAPELALHAMSLGVRGILRSTLAPELVERCLDKVHEGELWFEKALVDEGPDIRKAGVTSREIQLIRLLAQGLKNREIADTLAITEGTVKVYLSRLFQKLGVKDRFELALYGLKNPAAGTFRLPRTPLVRRGRKTPANRLPG